MTADMSLRDTARHLVRAVDTLVHAALLQPRRYAAMAQMEQEILAVVMGYLSVPRHA
jgi:hypothetical protein